MLPREPHYAHSAVYRMATLSKASRFCEPNPSTARIQHTSFAAPRCFWWGTAKAVLTWICATGPRSNAVPSHELQRNFNSGPAARALCMCCRLMSLVCRHRSSCKPAAATSARCGTILSWTTVQPARAMPSSRSPPWCSRQAVQVCQEALPFPLPHRLLLYCSCCMPWHLYTCQATLATCKPSSLCRGSPGRQARLGGCRAASARDASGHSQDSLPGRGAGSAPGGPDPVAWPDGPGRPACALRSRWMPGRCHH